MTEETLMDTRNQPDAVPTRKVAASGAVGLLAILGLAVLDSFGVTLPGVDVEALPVGEAFTGLAMFVAAYVTRERA